MVGELLPQPLGGLGTHSGHHPRQHGHSRQQHLVLDQPGGSAVEERLRPVGGCTRPRNQKASEIGISLTELPVAVCSPALPGVLISRLLSFAVGINV